MSQLNTSEQLCLSTLFQGGTSHCLELGGPSEVALDVVPPRDVLSEGSGERCHLLGLGDCSGAGIQEAVGVDSCSAGEAPCDKVNGWMWGPAPSKCDRRLPAQL